MLKKIILWVLCFCLVFAGHEAQEKTDDVPEHFEMWEYDITLQELRDGTHPEGEDDILIMTENATLPNGCPFIPDGNIGIQLEKSTFITEWKGLAKHSKSDVDIYQFLSEIKNDEQAITAVISRETLLTYDICLWKHSGIGDATRRRENFYRIIDADQMVEGTLYKIFWYRDEYNP